MLDGVSNAGILLVSGRVVTDLPVLPRTIHQKIVVNNAAFFRVSSRILTRVVRLRLHHHCDVGLSRHRLLKLGGRDQLRPPLIFETDPVHRVVLN